MPHLTHVESAFNRNNSNVYDSKKNQRLREIRKELAEGRSQRERLYAKFFSSDSSNK